LRTCQIRKVSFRHNPSAKAKLLKGAVPEMVNIALTAGLAGLALRQKARLRCWIKLVKARATPSVPYQTG